jgi:hypothetical protein
MPIEIRELIIKATVTEGSGHSGEAGSTTGSSSNNVSPTEAIVNICVEKILEIIKEKNER